ncbi:MAG: hypothetical protein EP326_08090 [Deltaproteobacteria bacterium]|jgi:hypothetical protein|nr:MAG: hypothetical protein EP326_08090 [Deltaproteobacteria bacterium]TNF27871.1 MAG: hypothetical protein EP319_10285 [Deltaproteobacteria bacterium]
MNDEALRRAQKELTDYLDEHPHLKEFQKELDKYLEELGDDPLLRMTFLMRAIATVMKEEMIPAMQELDQKLAELKSELVKKDAA